MTRALVLVYSVDRCDDSPQGGTVIGALFGATWVWWQAAVSAGFGAVFGFFGAYLNKRLEERRAFPRERLSKASDAVRETAPAVLNRLDQLLGATGNVRESVVESSRLLATAADEAFRNAVDALAAALRDCDREKSWRLTQVMWTLAKARGAWSRAHEDIVQRPEWDAARAHATARGGLDDADATRATELEPDEIDERLIEVARKEQERWTLWALLAQLQELRSDVAEAARIAGDVQGH